MQTSDVKYFESGFLVLTTATNGNVVLALQDISLKYAVEVEELLVFDNNFSKLVSPTFKSWSVSCSGVFTSQTGDLSHQQSGSTYITGGTGGYALLELIKTRSTTQKIVLMLGTSNFQKGGVLLTSFEVSSSAGAPLTYSLEMQGTTELTFSAT